MTKIGSNNRLRRSLRTTLAHFGLSSPDAAVRLSAIQDMLRSLDEAPSRCCANGRTLKPTPTVRTAIDTGLAMADLDGSDPAARLAAIQTLSSRVSSDVRNRLARFAERSPDGSFVESDAAVREAAAAALEKIDSRRIDLLRN